jgi:hypothetical protein
MANSQRGNIEYSENKKQRRIERKYNNLIEQALMDYKDKTMGELWDYLDNLKLSMKEELIKVGIISEDK